MKKIIYLSLLLATTAHADLRSAEETYKKGDFAGALAQYEEAAAAGSAAANCGLANLYMNGYGVPFDHHKAVELLLKGAKAGDTECALKLWTHYAMGDGAPANAKERLHWQQIAADDGEPNSQLFMGMLYAQDEQGTPADYAKAFFYLEKAAKQGVSMAQLLLGMMYRDGQGVPANPEKAVWWLQQAVAQNNGRAAYNLGLLLYQGAKGVPKDEAGAFRNFHIAAENGNANALYYLASMYHQGIGTPVDDAMAFKYAVAARNAHILEAITLLGDYYSDGIGTAVDTQRAKTLYEQAAKKGDSDAAFKLKMLQVSDTSVSSDLKIGPLGHY